ncbi:hypothetical protein HRR83_004439 [Exophiala dermatitidis]|nr:hypothetical protein HRR74_004281 [Exophiala dermatitidis]KAJ4529355.1 hypothetical protein HRR73_000378 [Exophiala dermatitidis]KAJ4543991.1 hypothetical protein HRR76_002066 [Exophiala dermatitidis]KAJ4549164.1 hypothetical protein HRR77_004042 [Exophiala dermatitidis]KAJ4575456.1 hypothetical protein HRR79_002377 [Exophiala dermatitidis]
MGIRLLIWSLVLKSVVTSTSHRRLEVAVSRQSQGLGCHACFCRSVRGGYLQEEAGEDSEGGWCLTGVPKDCRDKHLRYTRRSSILRKRDDEGYRVQLTPMKDV